ncbi:GGDEF domain-containing protein [Ramlibacter sp. PS3R-8]|uniref:GGDEF domain-containing protein n=1 Tax=Ramlibacter sp. PS3R-8 TaxID=3133437 RepID=UPI00309F76FE
MDSLAAGFWGAFFGTATLMLLAALAVFLRSQRRVALMAGLSAMVSAAFVAAYLGWFPVAGAAEARVLAHVAIVAATTLSLMLLSLLGLLRQAGAARRVATGLALLGAAVIGAGWLLDAGQALALSSVVAIGVGSVMLVVALRSALRGDRLAWTSVSGVSFMLIAVAGLSWIAMDRGAPWPVHAASALAGMAYLSVMALALWTRYSYLLELAEVMAHGPSYDPVTRMRSHSETGQLVGDVFFRRDGEARPIGVLAICVSNLYALENLHGRAAFNHALFVCAGRLRRCVPQAVEMGRLGDDGFLLLVRTTSDLTELRALARHIRDRLVRPVSLSTGSEPARLEAGGTAWVAEIGIGVLATSTGVRPSQAVTTARAMARTAWTYPSRLAFYDAQAGRIAELTTQPGSLVPGT